MDKNNHALTLEERFVSVRGLERHMKRGASILLVTLLVGCSPRAKEGAASSCGTEGALAYVCGLEGPEDIVQVRDTKWLLASSLTGPGKPVGAGRLYLIDSAARSVEVLFPGVSPDIRPDTGLFPDCPGPLDLHAFALHGLSLRERSNGVYRLYATSHGAREAIEVFELDARGPKPAVAWTGCVVLPPNVGSNGVVALLDGGFYVTQFVDPADPAAMKSMFSGIVTGRVYEWHPGWREARPVPGTELAGPNGIEVSPDGRRLFVAAFGAHEVLRFDGFDGQPVIAELGVLPDNLRWSRDGRLTTVGDLVGAPQDCGAPTCPTGWAVYEIDPETMIARRIGEAGPTAALQCASTALRVGGEIWIGTCNGDRVGVLPGL